MALRCRLRPRKKPHCSFATSREGGRDQAESRKFEIRFVEGKGLGAVATEEIRRGEGIWQEAPLLRVSRQLSLQEVLRTRSQGDSGQGNTWANHVDLSLRDCPEDQQRLFWELADVHAQDSSSKTAHGIVQTNGLPADSEEDPTALAIYSVVSRFNHSCKPNVSNSWQADRGIETLYAARDIRPGEELCITYIDIFQTSEQRQTELENAFKFRCTCEVCTQGGEILAASDRRRVRMAQLREALPSAGPLLEQVAFKIADLVDLELDGLPAAKCCAFHMGHQVAVCDGRVELASKFARLACQESLLAEGTSWRTQMLHNCAEDPSEETSIDFQWEADGMSQTP